MATRRTPVDVLIERGRKKVFAAALDWPGWCRAGGDDESAVEELAAYAPRYARVAELAGVAYAPGSARVVEVVAGNATTDFGAPDGQATRDDQRLTPAARARMAALVDAAWARLDEVTRASPPTMRKGPRGGGRDRDAMLAHVLQAEASYGRKIGVRFPAPAIGDRAAIETRRAALLDVLAGGPPPDAPATTPWPLRYAARRIAWHVLDHAWEMEDKAIRT